MSEAKTTPLPPAIQPVAWFEYARKKPTLKRLVFDRTSRSQLRVAGWVSEPLIRESDATAARADLEAEVQRLREALIEAERRLTRLIGRDDMVKEALTALAQLEAMVGAQEPQAEEEQYTRADLDRAYSVGLVEGERLAIQQAEAVPSSALNPDESDSVTLWAEIWRLREAVKGPDGYATWQDAATAERIRRVRAESKQAEASALIERMADALRSCSGVPHWPSFQPLINEASKWKVEAVPPSNLIDPGSVVSFAVDRWLAEVANRPLVNKNRRTLDDTWRQVIRRFGGDPDVLLGPPHDELVAIAQQKGQP